MNSNIENNYEEAFKLLANSDVPKNWYKDEETKTIGLIWHFTDINNMANILSFMKIESKNFAKQNNLVKNDNASKKVNNELTKAWVHDYARFYLHPKTPTQYRNEGIFEKNIDNKNLNLRLLNNNELWMTRPAHLPVPIFICFSLKNFLNEGGYVTTRSLAGGAVSNDVSKMLDKNLKKFKNNIFKIYNDKNSKNYEKQTEFIIKKSLDFEPGDIIKIVVRSNAEKLALLTMLEEHNAQYFSNKEQHQKIDISKYIDKIVVDSSIFFNDAGKLIMLKGHPRGNNILSKNINEHKS
ncbi:DarT ssDNA thymidine ADP-ribosyltransferase family protein [Lactobacillus intestinalis]|uniref:DarT ssDNA thymidine ADP-ribosyltransferase family protein n=1 Tax=Lactobacillus intestinalis TaxID=151781 RepID=UPI001F57E86E|nr:DarT ssDNA thymidine ADP-ribosyltransferase family protein [Lactobacillus intestinalis]